MTVVLMTVRLVRFFNIPELQLVLEYFEDLELVLEYFENCLTEISREDRVFYLMLEKSRLK